MRLLTSRIFAVLAASAAGLAVYAFITANRDITVPEVLSKPGTVVPTLQLAPLPAPANLADALARPLFRPDRRLFVAVPIESSIAVQPEIQVVPDPAQFVAPIEAPLIPEPPTIAPEAPPQLTVLGVHLSAVLSRALVASPDLPSAQWLSLGAEVAGWRLSDIGQDGIIIRQGERSLEFKLYDVDNLSQQVGTPHQAP